MMKKKIFNILYLIPIFMSFAVLGTSCSDDDDDNKTPPASLQLSITDIELNRLGLDNLGYQGVVDIQSNVYWKATVQSGEEWLTPSTLGGYGDVEMTLTVIQNDGAASRTGSIKLEALDGTTAVINVVQKGTSDKIYYVKEIFGSEQVDGQVIVDGFADWTETGISSPGFRGKGEGTFVDKENPSSGYADASGGNNILFSDADSYVVLGPMTTKGERSFKVSFASMSAESVFDSDDFVFEVSKDMSNWVGIDYTRASTTGAWAKSDLSFYYDDPYIQIYFRFVAKKAGTFRLDDFVVEESTFGAGKKLDFSTYIDDGKPVGHIYFQDDFSWIAEGPDFINNPSDPTSEIRFDNSGAATMSPEQQAALVASGWTWPTNANTIYMHKGYVKMGTASAGGAIISPALEDIESPAILNVKVSFDAALYRTSGGTEDPLSSMVAEISEGSGTINNGIDKSCEFPLDTYNDAMKTYTFVIYGATSETRIKFSNKEAKAKNRMFLDNVKVEKIAR